MFSKHPKGLSIIFLISVFERMAFYILFAILVLSMQTGFMLGEKTPGIIYAFFLFGVYILGIGGGYVADRWLGYIRSGLIGSMLMLAGYIMMAVPNHSLFFLCLSLTVIVVGNGFYKSNLVALLGNLYEKPEFKEQRDKGFVLFYMAINVGALVAPFIAIYAGNYIIQKYHFSFDVRLLELSQHYISGTLSNTAELIKLTSQNYSGTVTDLKLFCTNYVNAVSLGYNAAYAIAAVAMFLSMITFFTFRKHLKQNDVVNNSDHHEHHILSVSDKERIQTLVIVMVVVMFFWMSFYQNGNTLTLFANNYTEHSVSSLSYIFFDLPSVLLMMGVFGGIFILFTNIKKHWKIYSAIAIVFAIAGLWFRHQSFESSMPIKAEIFQYFNPFFCILFSPLLIVLFDWLHKNVKEPSTPKKIAIGMLLTAVSYAIMMMATIGLKSPKELHNGVSPALVSSWWLINVYLATTLGEIFISPMGMSFVSKVAPSHAKGVMQGAWYGAMALGNLLSGLVGTLLWNSLELWQFFFVFVLSSLLCALFVFMMVKRLEKFS